MWRLFQPHEDKIADSSREGAGVFFTVEERGLESLGRYVTIDEGEGGSKD